MGEGESTRRSGCRGVALTLRVDDGRQLHSMEGGEGTNMTDFGSETSTMTSRHPRVVFCTSPGQHCDFQLMGETHFENVDW